MKHSKIAIIGTGLVGSTTAYALILKSIIAEIILIDINENRCQGEFLDLSDSLFFGQTSLIRIGKAQDASNADIIIIAAGMPQNKNQSRTDLYDINLTIIKSILKTIQPIHHNAILIVVTNPLDALTFYIQQNVSLPQKQIFGTGTFLDTQRLRGILAKKYAIAEQSVHAYILGEHGDSQFAVWSSAQIAGTPITQLTDTKISELEEMTKEIRNKAYEIISCKGSTYYGIASCVAIICKAIIFNQKIVMPLSTYIKEFNTCLSVPVVVGENGIEKIMIPSLNKHEQQQLEYSAKQIKKLI